MSIPENNDSEYITDEQFRNLIEEISNKLQQEDVQQIQDYLTEILAESVNGKKYIDRTYIAKVKDQKRRTKIAEIASMLDQMSNQQVDNIHVYVVDEYDEPNHEAVALDAIIRLSKAKV